MRITHRWDRAHLFLCAGSPLLGMGGSAAPWETRGGNRKKEFERLVRLLGAIRNHRGWAALLGVVALSLAAVALGSNVPWASSRGQTREVVLEAKRFAYSPERISVRQGDRVVMRLQPQDVSHGLYVDGYGVDTHAMPTEEGVLQFTASNPGLYRFRCSVTCGPLHPFMVGELNVHSGPSQTNTPFLGAAMAGLVVGAGTLAFVWKGKERPDGAGS